jgi:hypothetical protein
VGEQGLEVAGVAAAAVRADPSRVALGVDAGVLQGFPGALQEHPVLRVQHERLAWRVAEEGGVEQVAALDDAVCRDATVRAGAEPGDAVVSGDQPTPERGQVVRLGKPAGHADDGDAVVGVEVHHADAFSDKPSASASTAVG